MDFRHLPEELVILVLECLPLTSALRCISVCKSWRRIISGPDFHKGSVRRLLCKDTEKSLAIIEVRGDRKAGFFIDPSYTVLESPAFSATEFGSTSRLSNRTYVSNDYYLVKVVGSCRGIVCFADILYGKYVLWNPATDERRALSSPDQGQHQDHCYVGFGHYGGEFKVVKIAKSFELFRIRAWIYELSLDSWREISSPIDQKFIATYNNMTCWQDGRMCSWIAHRNADRQNLTMECVFVSFDMANEAFTTFTSVFPFPFRSSPSHSLLLTLKDLLALCFSDKEGIDIWVFLQHCWVKVSTIRHGPKMYWPLEFWNGGLLVASHRGDRLLRCNPSNLRLPTPVVDIPLNGSSRVVAFEKTNASLYPDRSKNAAHKEEYKTKKNNNVPPQGISKGRRWSDVVRFGVALAKNPDGLFC